MFKLATIYAIFFAALGCLDHVADAKNQIAVVSGRKLTDVRPFHTAKRPEELDFDFISVQDEPVDVLSSSASRTLHSSKRRFKRRPVHKRKNKRRAHKPKHKRRAHKPKHKRRAHKPKHKRRAHKPKHNNRSGGGKWKVCMPKGSNSRRFGMKKPQYRNRPDGLRIHRTRNGGWRCTLEEYSGGFDGYWSVNAGDKHEIGLATAVKQMLRTRSNNEATKFLKRMMAISRPVNLDFPRDKKIADNGKRRANIARASRACTALIQVVRC